MFLFSSIFSYGQKQIDNNTAKKLLKDKKTQLLDVRTLNEVNNGKINGSIHIDYFSADFTSQCLKSLDKNNPIIVYCAAGGRSAKASKLLRKEGFKLIYDLSGGYDNWSE